MKPYSSTGAITNYITFRTDLQIFFTYQNFSLNNPQSLPTTLTHYTHD